MAAADGAETSGLLTETWAAERFAAQHAAALRCVQPDRRWLVWMPGACWTAAEGGEVTRAAIETARGILTDAGDPATATAKAKALTRFAFRCESRAGIEAVVKLAEVQEPLVARARDLDRYPMLVATSTGTIDLATGKSRAAERADLLTKLAGVPLVHAARCPGWERFLARVLPNEKVRAFVQRAAGYSLTGDVSEHALFFLYGLGRNGKSTFLAVLRHVFGDYAGSAPFDLLLTSRGEQHPTALAELAGRRLVVAVEAGAGRSLNEPLVKWLTGGDRLTARRMRQDFAEFQPTHKLWLAANHRPRVRGTDAAIWRRVKLVPFEVEIPEPEVDKHLVDKLVVEGPGILRWAIDGCMAWQREGLGEPEEVRAATAEYRKAEDRVGRFLEEACHLDPAAVTPVAELYTAYAKWCQESGEHPEPKRDFGEALTERGIEAGRTGRARVRVGLALGGDAVTHDDAVSGLRERNEILTRGNGKSASPASFSAQNDVSGASLNLQPEAIFGDEEVAAARLLALKGGKT